MKQIRENYQAAKVIGGEKNFQRGGHFVTDHVEGKILTFRCPQCFQHMSLMDYAISKTGVVTPDIVCPNPTCGSVTKNTRLLGHVGALSKKKGEVFLK